MKKNEFLILKQSFPVSKFDRECEAYKYIIENLSEEDLIESGISIHELNQTIKEGEKYLYRVAKENGKFKTMSISLHNFEIIRNKYMIFKDE